MPALLLQCLHVSLGPRGLHFAGRTGEQGGLWWRPEQTPDILPHRQSDQGVDTQSGAGHCVTDITRFIMLFSFILVLLVLINIKPKYTYELKKKIFYAPFKYRVLLKEIDKRL